MPHLRAVREPCVGRQPAVAAGPEEAQCGERHGPVAAQGLLQVDRAHAAQQLHVHGAPDLGTDGVAWHGMAQEGAGRAGHGMRVCR